MASPMTVHGRLSKMDTIQQKQNTKTAKRKESKWEILTNLDSATKYNIKPKKLEGILTKRRKWPMKGWHKRYFVLDNGSLSYGKSANEVKRGRTHGVIDVGTSVISAKTELYRIDIDDENYIHHIKASDVEHFGLWLEQLQQHRFYRQNQMNHGSPEDPASPIPHFSSPGSSLPRGLKPPTSLTGANKSVVMQEFVAMDERMTNQMLSVQQQAVNLGLLAQKMEDDLGSSSGSSKGKNFFGLRKKKSGAAHSSGNGSQNRDSNSRSSTLTSVDPNRPYSPVDLDVPENNLETMGGLSTSNPSLNSRPSSMNISLATKEELIVIIQDLQSDLASLVRNYTGDKERLKNAITLQEDNQGFKSNTLSGNMHQIAAMKNSLNYATQQNQQLRAKLHKIHMDSQVDDLPPIPPVGVSDTLIRGMGHPSLTHSSSCISEFFDAREYATPSDGVPSEYSSDEDIGSEGENEDSISEDDEEIYEEAPPPNSLSTEFESLENQPSLTEPIGTSNTLSRITGRRQKLPAVKADTAGLNLWNLLCKNIGKDLSKISMPVTLNEPLSVLQRLCEELEYSELLDKAAGLSDPVERMTYVAAFAVSAYGYCTARAGHKPFNPLLGETYECIREDKGFKYVSEQVSHHPPVSVCHATSEKWSWWQDFRVKTKFWGKSMEFQPEGVVNLMLVLPDGTKEYYSWNKITTCIHNLFSSGADRWADLYGECQIQCKCSSGENTLSCKLEFLKASGYWTSGKKHEVVGTINSHKGKVLQHLFGICTEALYCGKAPSARCIWRPGALPNECELFYGFSRFAIELNEILETERHFLPLTDTRFRPDQRALEEGQISEAETLKLKLEQAQRERRNHNETNGISHVPQWFVKTSKTWTFKDDYWTQRNDANFNELNLTELW